MSMEWRLWEPQEAEDRKPPSFWFVLVFAVVVFVVMLVLTVMMWGKGKPVISGDFFLRALLVPTLLSVGFGAWYYGNYEDMLDRIHIFNYLCHRTRARWHAWAQGRMAILGSVALTPEPELAERMLGLEGSPPANAGKTLALSASETDKPAVTRNADILKQLVMPFVPVMAGVTGIHRFGIAMLSERKETVSELRALLRTLDLPNPDLIEVTRLEGTVDAGLIDRWLNDGKTPDFCLVVACQLHQPEQEPSCSEVAASVLFTSVAAVSAYRERFKPQAYLFQPISSATNDVTRALRDLLTARPVTLKSVRHLWLAAMPRQASHAAVGAAAEAGLKVAVHDIDVATGKPGLASALLAQALAAEMVEHGQGTQLVATPGGAGVILNFIGMHLAPVPDVTPVDSRWLLFSDSVATICISTLAVIFVKIFNGDDGWLWGIFGYFVILMSIQMYRGWQRFGEVEDQFYGRSS